MTRRPRQRWSRTRLVPVDEEHLDDGTDDAPGPEDHDEVPERHTDEALSTIAGRLQGLGAEMRDLRALFEERLKYDEVREAHFTRLYDELEAYKRDEAGERLLSLARSVMLVIDKLEQEDHERLTWVAEELQECLASVGVETIEAPRDAAGPRDEQVVGFLEDEAPEDYRVLGAGYRYRERVVRPRRVMIRRDEANRTSHDAR